MKNIKSLIGVEWIEKNSKELREISQILFKISGVVLCSVGFIITANISYNLYKSQEKNNQDSLITSQRTQQDLFPLITSQITEQDLFPNYDAKFQNLQQKYDSLKIKYK